MRIRLISLFLVGAALCAVPLLAAPHSAAAFQRLQALAGDWEGKDEKGQPVKSRFNSIVSNTAVMETISPSGMEDMVTVYSLDGDGIALVHFCRQITSHACELFRRRTISRSCPSIFKALAIFPRRIPDTSTIWSSSLKTPTTSLKHGPGGMTEWTCRWCSISPARKPDNPLWLAYGG